MTIDDREGKIGALAAHKGFAVTRMTEIPMPPTSPRITGSHEQERHAQSVQTTISPIVCAGGPPR